MIEVFIDGCCEPINPGGNGGAGFIVKKDGKIIHQFSGYCGSGKEMTNNVAEYQAAYEAMIWLKSNEMKDTTTIYSDSMLVVQQLSGAWKIKKGAYLKHAIQSLQLLKQLPQIKFEWIPREKNVEADILSKIGANQSR